MGDNVQEMAVAYAALILTDQVRKTLWLALAHCLRWWW